MTKLRVLIGAVLAFMVVAAGWPASAGAQAPTVNKVLVFVEENHSLAQMRSGMPYLYSQATQYGYADHYTAITHPSLPNYLAIAGGSTFGIADDMNPSEHHEPSPDVFGAALAAGRTAKSYQESMPANCTKTNSGNYAVRHNPWAYFPADGTACNSHDVPAGTVSSGALRKDVVNGTLPNVGEVTPNLIHDAHNASLAAADTWLKGWLKLIYASPDWKSGHLAIIVTADEDGHNAGNTVLTVVLHPSQSHHVVHTALTHYSLNALLTQTGHAACIRNGCSAPGLATAFGLPRG